MSKKVVVIDDEADVRAFLVAVLKKHGYQTATASNGSEGLDVVKRERPDLVILDLMMPNQSGTDFYRNLSKSKELADIPVIIVSGLPGRHLAVKKPAAVFDKPINPPEFIAAVEQALADIQPAR
jgi:two-component system cell cycle response regulator DivK